MGATLGALSRAARWNSINKAISRARARSQVFIGSDHITKAESLEWLGRSFTFKRGPDCVLRHGGREREGDRVGRHQTRILNMEGMYRWVSPHRWGEC